MISPNRPGHALIIEDASLEIVPREIRSSKAVAELRRRFGVAADMQILDRNFHLSAMKALRGNNEKRGRPDVVHYALLDATSTPLFLMNRIQIFVHTVNDETVEIAKGTRLPRTLPRFCGVMASVLARKTGDSMLELLKLFPKQTFTSLIRLLKPSRIICLSEGGRLTDLETVVRKRNSSHGLTVWVVGGFPHGDFDRETSELCNECISISDLGLPAHVVTARLCYAIEKSLGSSGSYRPAEA